MIFAGLSHQDTIDLVEPSSPCDDQIIANMKAVLSTWPVKSRVPDDLWGPSLPFLANSDEERFKHLAVALTASDSSVVWCVRGGYGATRLLPYLQTLPQPTKPKLLVGSSDITALHLFVQQRWGWTSLHAPNASWLGDTVISDSSKKAIEQVLLKGLSTIAPSVIIPMNAAAEQVTSITAHIIGGNLTLVQTSLGTPWQIRTANKIVLLEEVGERAYRIDRSLQQLKQAQVFENVPAILLGDFIGGEEASGQDYVPETLAAFMNNLTIPVFRIPGIGHGFINLPLPLGLPMQIVLNTANHWSLSLLI